ncbi:copine-8-like isoform X2 [Dinothrombium tinctorium]|uniref:Copine-8-like isoform X2 n=1 Tax=Dinothrombium tinctorium TaxID=1965070 RepID=A0A3S3RLY7_9ACAR
MPSKREKWETITALSSATGISSLSHSLTSIVELSISCENLFIMKILRSKIFCVIYLKDSNQDDYVNIGQTEFVKINKNPNFEKKFILNYNRDLNQEIMIEVFAKEIRNHDYEDELKGSVETTLRDIVAMQGSQLKLEMKSKNSREAKCYVNLVAEELSSNKELVDLQFKGTNLKRMLFFLPNDPYFTIAKVNKDGSRSVVYKSEVCKRTSNPYWKPFTLRVTTLNNGDFDRPLVFECCDESEDGHKQIGSFTTTLNELCKSHVYKNFELKKKDRVNGKIELTSLKIAERPSFMDYFHNGVEIHFTVAIDFTKSNGNPQKKKSLHYLDPNNVNPTKYEIALRAVGEIAQLYSSDNRFRAFGFGAQVNGVYQELFALNSKEDHPYLESAEQLTTLYKQKLNNITLGHPTKISSVIDKIASDAQEFQNGKHYFVLLIVTDGVLVSDLWKTKESIVTASKQPLSIVFVGVGNEDFEEMEEWADDEYGGSYFEKYPDRHIIQFVRVNNFVSDSCTWIYSHSEFEQNVVRKIPEQVVDYFIKNSIKPF